MKKRYSLLISLLVLSVALLVSGMSVLAVEYDEYYETQTLQEEAVPAGPADVAPFEAPTAAEENSTLDVMGNEFEATGALPDEPVTALPPQDILPEDTAAIQAVPDEEIPGGSAKEEIEEANQSVTVVLIAGIALLLLAAGGILLVNRNSNHS